MEMIKFKLPNINLSVQLAGLFLVALFFGNVIPTPIKSIIYALSLTIKEILLFILPLIIFSCLFHSLLANKGKVLKFIAILLSVICFSNFISILAAYGIGTLTLNEIGNLSPQSEVAETLLDPLWSFTLPQWLRNEHALFLGLALGVFISFFPNPRLIKLGEIANTGVTLFLQKIIVPLLPLFAFGYILKMQHEGLLTQIIGSYGRIILLIVVANLLYLFIMFLAAARFNIKNCLGYIKNVLPAGILGFSTMSSMVTMPVTLNAAEKNTGNPELVRAVIPATVNIHMVGDSISIPILAMAVLLSFGSSLPDLNQYLIFTAFFMLIKFSVPGIPCGTILVMLPILEKYFGFTAEMSAFITAIYILFDSVITVGNVLGNSALVIILSRLMPSVNPVVNNG